MKALLLFQACVPPVRWPVGVVYTPLYAETGGPYGPAEYFRLVPITCESLSAGAWQAREHEQPSDHFVGCLPVYGEVT